MPTRLLSLFLALLLVLPLRADVPLPARVLDPQTPAEAWNIIGLATANMTRLVTDNRLGEIPVQASLCSPALRRLGQNVKDPAFVELGALASTAVKGDAAGTRAALDKFQKQLTALAGQYDAKIVRAEIYQCPMHPDCVAPDAVTPCAKCGMDMLLRRIPYSFIYTPPGQPTMTITATASEPLVAGRKAEVKVRLKKGDGSPVTPADLLIMHTERIHLLIVDPTLGDYHHEHPKATETPGEYAFSFTPKRGTNYRIFADLVAADTGVQEYPFADLAGGPEKAGAVEASADRLESEAGGLRFQLGLGPEAKPLRVGETRLLSIKVTDAQGKPVSQLAPVMNAFAHLVGFYEDYRTIVHIHPEGGEITNAELRGGPAMSFRFFPPRAGHIRLYCQVLYEGRMIFAPFDVNVAP